MNDDQRGDELQEKPARKDSTLDMLTIMSDRVTVKFKISVPSRLDERFISVHGKRKALHKGGNSSCRRSIIGRSHGRFGRSWKTKKMQKSEGG